MNFRLGFRFKYDSATRLDLGFEYYTFFACHLHFISGVNATFHIFSFKIWIQLVRVTIQSRFKLIKSCCLHLISVLQPSNPFSLLSLQSSNLTLNLHSLLILLINLSNQLLSLHKSQTFFFHQTIFNRLFFLITHHLLHTSSFQLLSVLLDSYHFLVLFTFCFKSLCVTKVFFCLTHLLVLNCCLLLLSELLIFHHKSVFFFLTLLFKVQLFLLGICVALSYSYYVIGFLFCFLNFFPCLQEIAMEYLTFCSSCLRSAIRLARSLTSSWARFLVTRWSARAPLSAPPFWFSSYSNWFCSGI